MVQTSEEIYIFYSSLGYHHSEAFLCFFPIVIYTNIASRTRKREHSKLYRFFSLSSLLRLPLSFCIFVLYLFIYFFNENPRNIPLRYTLFSIPEASDDAMLLCARFPPVVAYILSRKYSQHTIHSKPRVFRAISSLVRTRCGRARERLELV